MQYNLDEVWELIDMNNQGTDEGEKEIIFKFQNVENELLINLDDDQKKIFSRLMDTLSEISYTERRDAFKKGIRFATQFLLDATKTE